MKIAKALELCRGAHSSPCVHLQERIPPVQLRWLHNDTSTTSFFLSFCCIGMSALFQHLGPTDSPCGVSYGCVPALGISDFGRVGAPSDLGLRWVTSEIGLCGMGPKPAFGFTYVELVLSRPASDFDLDCAVSDIVRSRMASLFFARS